MSPNSKRYLLCILALLMLAGGSAFAQDERIVFVDLDAVFNGYYKTKHADAKLKDQADEFNDERKKLVKEYDEMEALFNSTRSDAQNLALSEEVRNSKRDLAEEQLIELRKKERSVRRFEEGRRKQLDEQQRRMRKGIVEEIRQHIETYARENSYTAVLDRSGQSLNGVETVVYADVRTDITEDIIDLLNAGKTVDSDAETVAGPEADEEEDGEEAKDGDL